MAVFGSSLTREGNEDYNEARRLGELLADAGVTVATGGYGGTMEAVSRGAIEQGGHVIGVTAPAMFPTRTGANRYVTEEIQAATLTERIHQLVGLSDAGIALPGSIGTFTELMVAWYSNFIACHGHRSPKPLVAVGSRWASLVPNLIEELDTPAGNVECVATVGDAAELVINKLRST